MLGIFFNFPVMSLLQLTLPELVGCEVSVSCGISPGHFFLQQPTHPSYSSLNQLDLYMLSLYSRGGQTIPELPKPCQSRNFILKYNWCF